MVINKHICLILCIIFSSLSLSGCINQNTTLTNTKPIIQITHPTAMESVLGIINITGTAYDEDGISQLEYVQIRINKNSTWKTVQGTEEWLYQWNTYAYPDGTIQLFARSYDGIQYSNIDHLQLTISNPEDVDYNSHKWAVFITAANFPEDNTSKLGNGGLYLSENMSTFFIEELQYSTTHVHLLFDDGWLRDSNGFGEPIKKLENSLHPYNITYGAATKENVVNTLNTVVDQANKYDDSEVFLWVFNHGFGDYNKQFTGGKILERSAVFLWDGYLIDNELGQLLEPLQSEKTCIIIDACYSGGFADKTIYNFQTLPALRSNIPQPGRVVITSTSKFRTGIAIIEYGPLFSLLWFNGLNSGSADGFRPGILKTGRLPFLVLSDGKVSVEEAFYYARYMLRTNENINKFKTMQPQINDRYPGNRLLNHMNGLHLGE